MIQQTIWQKRRIGILAISILVLVVLTASALLPDAHAQAHMLRQPESNPAYHRVEHPHWPNALEVPVGFTVDEVASNLQTPRFMALDSDGNLFYGSYSTNSVVRLVDQDGNGSYDVQQTVATGLSVVHSVAFFQGQLYAAAQDRVVRLSDFAPNGRARRIEPIITGLPSVNGYEPHNHRTRTILFGPDGMLYLSIGSSCDVCEESNPLRATVQRIPMSEINGTIDATQMQTFASGLRNTVGLAIHPATGSVWGMDMGRDYLGPDLPPEELNHLQAGKDYGWPYCYGNRQPNPEYNNPSLCNGTMPPSYVFPAHWAPLGIDFYDQAAFPGYRNDALVAFHGSAPSQTNNTRQGARVVRVQFAEGRPVDYHDLLRGFEIGNRTWARPAGVLVAPDGSVLVSDDYGGRIFRIRYVGNAP